jgi:GTPase SAR1 family protein
MLERSCSVNAKSEYLANRLTYLDKMLADLVNYDIKLDMEAEFNASIKDRHEAAELSIAVGKTFQPRTPISTRQLFAGRWEQCTAIMDAVNQKGLHVIIFGERGVGKTSLANVLGIFLDVMEQDRKTGINLNPRLVVKVNVHQGDTFAVAWNRVFEEVSWFENKPTIGINPSVVSTRTTLKEAFGISDTPTIDEVRRTLGSLPRSVLIFDEFDRGSAELRTAFTDTIKALSDYAVDSTVIIVGVSDTVDHLIRDHASIVRAVVQIQLPRMNERELSEILENGEKALNIKFDQNAAKLIVRMSQGLPHYTHLVGLHATRQAVDRLSRVVQVDDVHKSFEKAIQQAVQTIQEKYLLSIRSAHKDALYDKVILACAAASSAAKDALGYFHPADAVAPLSSILKRENVIIATFQKHMNEFCEKERGPVLERSGVPRAYKYRFHDPMMPPYIFMTAIANGSITIEEINRLAGEN